MTEETHYTNDFLDAFQNWIDTTECDICDISIKEALRRAFEAGYEYCASHNRYLKEALIAEQKASENLSKEVEELKAYNEKCLDKAYTENMELREVQLKMRCCGNCDNNKDTFVNNAICKGCINHDKWELAE